VAVAHGGGGVEQEVGPEVGLLLVLLDVEAVAFGEDLPVQVPRVDAGGVLAVLGELDGEPPVRRPVLAGVEPLDDESCGQAEVLQFGQGRRVEVPCSFCLLYTSPSPRDATLSRMPSSA